MITYNHVLSHQSFSLLRGLAVGILPRQFDELLGGQADHFSHLKSRRLDSLLKRFKCSFKCSCDMSFTISSLSKLAEPSTSFGVFFHSLLRCNGSYQEPRLMRSSSAACLRLLHA